MNDPATAKLRDDAGACDAKPVPPEYVGVWKRTLLRTPSGEDSTSQVYWLQTTTWHADIRIPADRPACAGKTSLAQLNRRELLALAAQRGFAGITVVEGDICRWRRRHDFQPPTGARDIGRMVFDAPNRLLEYGVEADYFEVWERLPDSNGETFACNLSREPPAWFLAAGRFFMLVRPRKEVLPVSPHLTKLAEERDDAALRRMLDFEISFGTRGEDGRWRRTLSTLPWLEGTPLTSAEAPAWDHTGPGPV